MAQFNPSHIDYTPLHASTLKDLLYSRVNLWPHRLQPRRWTAGRATANAEATSEREEVSQSRN